MKKLLVLSLAISILFFACSENTNLVDPLDQRSNNAAPTIQPLKTNLTWMSLPSTKSSKFFGETQVTGEQVIDLSIGGDVTAFYASADGRTTISAKLYVPKGALKNVASLRFYMLIDNEKLSIKFEPHPTYFDIPLTLDLTYTGLDLSGIDPSKIYFAYLDDPTTGFIITNDHILIDKRTGTLGIAGGKIPHFSEYGFVR
jgi:hypothetical protein